MRERLINDGLPASPAKPKVRAQAAVAAGRVGVDVEVVLAIVRTNGRAARVARVLGWPEADVVAVREAYASVASDDGDPAI